MQEIVKPLVARVLAARILVLQVAAALGFATATLAMTGIISPAQAACIVEYKARKGPPLKLHYGVLALPDRACERPGELQRRVQRRIARDGWKLLVILSARKADPARIPERMKELRKGAGKYFLRY